MSYLKGVFNTDQVNRQNIMMPVDVMAGGLTTALSDALRNGLPAGTPSHISHDVHRLMGWCVSLGIYLSEDVARQVGYIRVPDSEDEQRELEEISRRYWARWQKEFAEKFEVGLRQRAAAPDPSVAFDFCNAAVLRGAGLASTLYPELFNEDSALVDKDGLVDYRALKSQLHEIQPGIFRDPARGLVLFAHPFFRRSLSRRNTLNSYFLRALADCAERHKDITVRLRLDPDMVGHPDSIHFSIELEYWRGPHFDADIAKIPNGVAEHKASDRTRFFEGVDKTQFWWKASESRPIEDEVFEYRTFEAEELVENASEGVSDRHFGCRYVHSEYSVDGAHLSHFDGAIRTYEGEAYLERIERSIDRAGKKSDYTKLFRFDGKLPVEDWKTLCTDYFRGNDLLPEYFDGRAAATSKTAAEKPSGIKPVDDLLKAGLGVLVSFDEPPTQDCIYTVAEEEVPHEGMTVHCIEVPRSTASRQFLHDLLNLSHAHMVEHPDKVMNFPRIILGRKNTAHADWSRVAKGLVAAIRADAEGGR